MTTINAAKEAILARFNTAWAGQTPAFFDNEGGKDQDDSWVRVVVRMVTSQQESLGPAGARKFLRRGIILVQVFTPPDQGTAESDGLVQDVLEALESANFSGVWTDAGEVRDIGVLNKWYQANISIGFTFEETK